VKTPAFRLMLVAIASSATAASAAPVISRLTLPSTLYAEGRPFPVISRFIEGQRFDLQATIQPDPGQTIASLRFAVNGHELSGTATLAPADATGLPANSVVASRRAYSNRSAGLHTLTATAVQSDGQTVSATGNFEIVGLERSKFGARRGADDDQARERGQKARNVIFFIGDGMGIAHRTAARLMLSGATQGKARGLLNMDTFPSTGIVMTHSLNSIVTDSSPGAACYSTGNKSNNNQHGVFPDDTTALFDNPRVESIGQLLQRREERSLGLVTTSDVFDATPAAWASHTQSRAAGTGIVDQYLDERRLNGLTVLLGGGRKWFLPSSTPGSARTAATDYVLPSDLASAWGVPAGAVDPARDLIADYQEAGFTYVANATQLKKVPKNARKLLGLFSLSNMNVALDKIQGRRGISTVVNDYGFPDQPMLDEMTEKALEVLEKNKHGFVLMVEGASIDKQAHNMDSERWMLDLIEFDRAIGVAEQWASERDDTLIVVTADHECAGVNIIGASRVANSSLLTRAQSGGGAAQLRNGVVGTYEAARFPRYTIAPDGYPASLDPDFKLLIGYAANADRYEDWLTNAQPLRDSQQPFNSAPPLNTYPTGPLNQDTAGNFLVSGQVADSTAAHTASDIPLSAYGVGAHRFVGVMDNTDVFFRVMESAL
jgi:alkaline phosphatase